MGGLLGYALAAVLMIRSGLGLGPWDAFHVGLSLATGITVGSASIAVGLLIVCGTWFIGVRPGPGTVANMVLIGVFIDLLLLVVPEATPWFALPYHILGILLVGVATGMYIAPGLGKGPRDGLMLGLSRRTGVPAGRVRTGIEATVLLLGWLMGGAVGVGTILFALAVGPVTQRGLDWFGVTSGVEQRGPAPHLPPPVIPAPPPLPAAPDPGPRPGQGV